MKTPTRLPALVLVLLAAALPGQEPERGVLRTFRTQRVSREFLSEGAAFGDLDRDGHADVVSGPWWYAGPDFARRHALRPARSFDPARYSDAFFAFVHDFDGDGWPDVLSIGFPGKDASWYENPGRTGRPWARHRVFDGVDNESPAFTDLDGDGRPELVCQHGGKLGWAAPPGGDPREPWTFHAISPRDIGGRFTHGLGVGDVTGDGRPDVLWKRGFFEQPASLDGDPRWKHHAHVFAARGGAQMYAYDVDGDGDGDVLTSEDAHGYGLAWFEQREQEGRRTFARHRIMGGRPEHNRYGVVVGNLHAVALADVDGDGLRDVVTGNRYWAHGGRDEADREVPALYWFRLVRAPEGVRFVPHLVHGASGVGTQVVAGDVDGDGLVDVVVGNKLGTFVHLQSTREVPRDVVLAAEPRPIASFEDPAAARVEEPAPEGRLPVGREGRPINTDFETGDLRDWTASGEAFDGLPARGDTVHARREDSRSRHQGSFWVGTYEPQRSDAPQGTLTSAPFRVTAPFASFLVGGGRHASTRVELVRRDTGEVVHRAPGRNREDMVRRVVDLTEHVGRELFIRLVDAHSGGWGHVNFDDFRLHDERPRFPGQPVVTSPTEQPRGYSGGEAARRMRVPEGFRVELVASEPDVHQPIALAIDERGRLFVAEAHAYPVRRPEGEGRDKIVVFEDADSDGDFESRTVFQDGLNLVSGLEVGFGGVFVGAAPHLLFIPDADGDLRPDGPPEVLLDGFGHQDTHETLNAFNWGPDGWLYGCHGVFTHSRVGAPGTPDEDRVPMNCAVWRYHPQKRRFEVFARGGSNQWGVDFDDDGQCFITACVIPHLYHVVQGGRYHRQAGRHFRRHVYEDIDTIADHVHWVGDRPHDGNLVSDAVGGGHAHCGALVYLGGRFPPFFRNQILFSNIHGNRINVDLLRRSGSGYVGSHGEDLVVARDRWFRGIALRCGPDGNVYLTDWYDRQACHRKDPRVWDRTNGRIYRVAWGDPAPVSVDLGKLTDEELVGLHLHRNDWYVRTARRLLMERGPGRPVRERLERMAAEHPDPRRRLRALWTLHATGLLREAFAMERLESPHEYVRAWTVQLLLEDRAPSRDVAARLVGLAHDSSQVVRLYLASALQRLPHAARWDLAEGLLAHRVDAADQNIPLMIWYGIEPLVPEEPERALALAREAQIPRVRAFVARRLALGGPPLVAVLVAEMERCRDAGLLRTLLAELHRALAGRRDVPMPAAWPRVARRLLGDGGADEERVLALSVAFGDDGVRPELRRILSDRSRDRRSRERALESLLGVKDPGLVPVLHGLLDDPELRGPAVRALAAFDDDRTPGVLLASWSSLPPAVQDDCVTTLTSRAAWARALLEAVLEDRLPASVLDGGTTRRQIAAIGDPRVDALMAQAWGRARPTPEDVEAAIGRWVARMSPEVLARADRPRGREVFTRTCMRCHRLFGEGRDVGPDLTGSNRDDVRYLFTNMLAPSAEVAREYVVTHLQTRDGRNVSGIAVDSTDDAVTVRTENDTLVVPRADIARDDEGEPVLWTSELSMMPDDQLQGLEEDEVRDLVAYLRGRSQVPLRATPETAGLLFDGASLAFWDGDPAVWSVSGGEIVGRTASGLRENAFLRSHLLLEDFRLTLEVRLVGGRGNSGVQFRSAVLEGGGVKGYQADVGPGWWGKLYEEHGRGVLADVRAERFVRPDGWNTYEILAVGPRIRTALNGRICADLEDPGGRRSGIVALQVHSGGPTEVRFRNLSLELDPKPRLETVR